MVSRKIMIIRHAEKPDADHAGVDKHGQQDSEELIVRGWQRAGALVRFFAPLSESTVPGLAVPKAIYASKIANHSASKRPEHTVMTLSNALHININLTFSKEKFVEMAQAVAQLTEPVLIAWEHQKIPAIVKTITNGNVQCPQQWPDDRFDLVWVLDRDDDNSEWCFSQVPQMLLPGDSREPIEY